MAANEPATTKFLSRLLGLWLLFTITSMLANRQATFDLLDRFFTDAPLVFVTGVFTLLIGLAILLVHNRWSGGLAPAIVTLYGWAALLKGMTLLCLPNAMQQQFYAALHFTQFAYAYFLVALALGGYMVYYGFKSDPSTS